MELYKIAREENEISLHTNHYHNSQKQNYTIHQHTISLKKIESKMSADERRK